MTAINMTAPIGAAERRGVVSECSVTTSGTMRAEPEAHSHGPPRAEQRVPIADPFWPAGLTFECVLARARTREREALSLIYRRFLPVVYRFLLSRVADVPLAEDLTSETFFAVMAGIDEV